LAVPVDNGKKYLFLAMAIFGILSFIVEIIIDWMVAIQTTISGGKHEFQILNLIRSDVQLVNVAS
jgi:hypothetical protein